jgi:hypothetical protein
MKKFYLNLAVTYLNMAGLNGLFHLYIFIFDKFLFHGPNY